MTITGIINEEWRSISGFANYQVSNTGLVKNIITLKNAKQCRGTNGYYQVRLINNNGYKNKQSSSTSG